MYNDIKVRVVVWEEGRIVLIGVNGKKNIKIRIF
jgi:hypothetical protein